MKSSFLRNTLVISICMVCCFSKMVLANPNQIFSGDNKVEFSEVDKFGESKCVGVLDDMLITIDSRNDILRVFNEKLAVVSELKFKETATYKRLKSSVSNIYISRVEIINEKVVVFYFYKTKKQKNKVFAYEVFDPKSGVFHSKRTEPLLVSTGTEAFKGKGLYLSKNKTKIAIVRGLPRKKDQPYVCQVTIFNDDFEKKIQYKGVFPRLGKGDIYYETPVVLENGDIYVSTRERVKENKSSGIKDNSWHYRYYYFNGKLKKISGYDLDIDGKSVLSSYIYVDNFDVAKCVGYYKDSAEMGVFRINLGDIESNIETTPLGVNFKTWYSKEEFLESDTKFSVLKHKVKNAFNTEDNGVIVISEKEYTRTKTKTGSDGSVNTTYYYHNDSLFISKLNSQGELEWTTIIDKMQRSVNDFRFKLSFSLHIEDGILCIIYNDCNKNYDSSGKPIRKIPLEDINFKINVYRPDLLVMDKIDLNSGFITREVLHDNTIDKYAIIPKASYSHEKGSALYFYSRKTVNTFKGKLGKISFD